MDIALDIFLNLKMYLEASWHIFALKGVYIGLYGPYHMGHIICSVIA